MLGRRIDPPSGLQLVNLSQTLKPGLIDNLTFGYPGGLSIPPRGKRNVTLYRVVTQVFQVICAHKPDYRLLRPGSPGGLTDWCEPPCGLKAGHH